MTKTDPLIVTSQHPQLSRSVESLTATHDGWTYTREIQARGAAQVAAEDLDHWRTMFRPQDGVHPDRDSAFQHARDAHLFVHAITVDDLVAFYQRRGWAPLTEAQP